jgi:tryptophan synthase beta chain
MKQQEGSLPPYLVTGSPPPAGRFGSYGGQFVPEVLMPALERLSQAAVEIMADGGFTRELSRANQEFIGRPTPLTECRRLGERWGVKVWLKREDLCHTGPTR